jgi:hypothetical protein
MGKALPLQTRAAFSNVLVGQWVAVEPLQEATNAACGALLVLYVRPFSLFSF